MKRISIFSTLLLSLFLPLTALAATTSSAPHPLPPRDSHLPDRVTFFSTEILVEVERNMQPERLPDGDYGYILPLPVQALGNSLMVQIDGTPAPVVRWLPRSRQVPLPYAMSGFAPVTPGLTMDAATEKDPLRKALLLAFLTALEQTSAIEVTLQSIKRQTDMWNSVSNAVTGGDAPLPAAGSLVELGASLHENLIRLGKAKDSAELAMHEATISLNTAVENLQRHDWRQNTVLVAVAADSASAKKRIQYRYIMPGSSNLDYTLNASPEQSTLGIVQNITLRQESGIDWDNVETFAALTVRGHSPFPGVLSPWFIQYAQKPIHYDAPRYASKSYEQAEPPAPVLAQANSGHASPQRVREVQEMSSFRLWSLGKNTIRSHDSATVNLATDTHKAEFFYTLRPSLGKRGFLTARVAFAEPVELPQGRAVCFVDNAFVGEQPLAANGKEALFFLGEDPQITIDKRDLTNKSGSTGIFNKEQTRTLHWAYTVQNHRNRTVDVVVEERAPISKDESITINSTSSPKPEDVMPAGTESHQALRLFVWKKTLNPAETLVIDHKIIVNANTDKQLDM